MTTEWTPDRRTSLCPQCGQWDGHRHGCRCTVSGGSRTATTTHDEQLAALIDKLEETLAYINRIEEQEDGHA